MFIIYVLGAWAVPWGKFSPLLLDTGEIHLKYYPLGSKRSWETAEGLAEGHQAGQGPCVTHVLQGRRKLDSFPAKESPGSHLQLCEGQMWWWWWNWNSLLVPHGTRSNGHIIKGFKVVSIAPFQEGGWVRVQRSFIIKASVILWRACSNFRVKCATAVYHCGLEANKTWSGKSECGFVLMSSEWLMP